MRKIPWSQQLNYIACEPNEVDVIYQGIYHGETKDFYYVGKSNNTSGLGRRWQQHHQDGLKAKSITICDLFAAITVPDAWEIHVLERDLDAAAINAAEQHAIENLFKEYDTTQILNSYSADAEIPSEKLISATKRRDKWVQRLMKVYPNKALVKQVYAAALNNELGFKFDFDRVPPVDPVFYVFHDDAQMTILERNLPGLLNHFFVWEEVLLAMRNKYFKTNLLPEIRQNTAEDALHTILQERSTRLEEHYSSSMANYHLIPVKY